MKIEMEIISKEFIKPSSPTPDHNKTLKLSLLDQIVPPIYAPLVLYYPNLDNTPKENPDFISHTTQTLKQSLSETLTRFYPLAGRVKDALSIDCNDEGVLFVVAKINTNLSDFLEKPDPQACRTHIPSQLSWSEPGPGSHVAMIQLNFFSCGGLAVGALFLHKIADGVTIRTFTGAWAHATRGGSFVGPDYSAPHVFLQNESLQRESYLFSIMRRYFGFGKTVMRRYVFDASAMEKLRSELKTDGGRRPSRVEIVSAVMWKYFMVASSNKKIKNNNNIIKNGNNDNDDDGSENLVSLMTHIVNMRRKAEPPLPEHSFGNIVWLTSATSSNSNSGDRELEKLFGKVRSAIGKVDVDLVKSMQGDDGFSGYLKNLGESLNEFPEKADYLAITSWCNFGFYEVDFGWGKPAWISKCDAGSEEWPFINVLWLMDTRDGEGIEAWITLDANLFDEFDQIQELRDLAIVDPSPLSGISDRHKVVTNGLDHLKIISS